MILINLLPHREVRRQRRKQLFFVGLGVSAGVGVLIVGAWYLVIQAFIGAQQDRNSFLQAEIRKLDAEIRDIQNLRAEIDSLRARQQAVESLQANRNIPVHMLDELTRQVPEGVYLTSIRQTGDAIAVTGLAQSNERVSELLRNTNYSSQWVGNPDLVEIKSATVGGRRLFDFSMRLGIKRPNAEAAQQAAGQPATPVARPAGQANRAPRS